MSPTFTPADLKMLSSWLVLQLVFHISAEGLVSFSDPGVRAWVEFTSRPKCVHHGIPRWREFQKEIEGVWRVVLAKRLAV